ncbi:hypothetical protein [Brevundimonas sp.]|jgi:hypothetical protein|uniref:hypothetical protein n=1 Tax=Brevundimonas sp. TaxID=1871086 RepID=UPI0037C13F60
MLHKIRLFWTLHHAPLGIVLVAFALIAVIAAGLIFVQAPQSTTGRVVSFDIASSRRGDAPAAMVQVEGRLARVKVYRRISCLIGEDMALRRYDTPVGSFYRLASVPSPCQAPSRP